ncbi:MAG: deoxycytidine triphosphate deaminase [Cycloclasticus sp. symbiont of Poecilosclerida sp. M]|nr:MAG: deoxycytidine triphosphate deaminase [Cycloclasticus sp. symbiont of Poecilosclerida sp. M]
MDKQTQLEIEAAAFRRIINHFQTHTDVQNIDLMNLANFCRNCFSKWYMAEAKEKGVEIDYDAAREVVYGMPFTEWKEKHQKPATPEQLTAFEEGEKRRKGS